MTAELGLDNKGPIAAVLQQVIDSVKLLPDLKLS
jgi:hypothetical protein